MNAFYFYLLHKKQPNKNKQKSCTMKIISVFTELHRNKWKFYSELMTSEVSIVLIHQSLLLINWTVTAKVPLNFCYKLKKISSALIWKCEISVSMLENEVFGERFAQFLCLLPTQLKHRKHLAEDFKTKNALPYSDLPQFISGKFHSLLCISDLYSLLNAELSSELMFLKRKAQLWRVSRQSS